MHFFFFFASTTIFITFFFSFFAKKPFAITNDTLPVSCNTTLIIYTGLNSTTLNGNIYCKYHSILVFTLNDYLRKAFVVTAGKLVLRHVISTARREHVYYGQCTEVEEIALMCCRGGSNSIEAMWAIDLQNRIQETG